MLGTLRCGHREAGISLSSFSGEFFFIVGLNKSIKDDRNFIQSMTKK
jgi:hypothetical protein